MDITLARTFLAIVETGSFVEAAKKIHVNQSTVSVRMKTLEDQLGRPVFQRGNSGAALTHAGRQFHRHAQTLVRVWQSAKLDVALPEGVVTTLAIGGQPSLWEGYLIDWAVRLRSEAPEIALTTELGFSATLVDALANGELDLAVLYAPQLRPGYLVERLFDDEFVMVSRSNETNLGKQNGLPENYTLVDWGAEFLSEHAAYFPDQKTPAVQLRIGSLGLSYLFATGSAGYFPKRVVEPLVTDEKLFVVEFAPLFHCPAFALFPEHDRSEPLETALRLLREVAADIKALQS